MKLLAVDTATEACTVGLLVDGELCHRFELAPRRHATLVLGMVESLLGEAGVAVGDLDVVAFGQGPGAFTGLRIAAAVVQGVAFAVDIPVVPVSSLAATAQRLVDDLPTERCIVAFDARMDEVYLGVYERGDDGLVTSCDADRLVAPRQAPAVSTGSWLGAGTGWQAHREQLLARYGEHLSAVVPEAYPHGGAMARLAARDFAAGAAVPADRALPVYLRNRVAEIPPPSGHA